MQYGSLLLGHEFTADPSIFFAAGLTGSDSIHRLQSNTHIIWWGVSIVCFVLYFIVLVRLVVVTDHFAAHFRAGQRGPVPHT